MALLSRRADSDWRMLDAVKEAGRSVLSVGASIVLLVVVAGALLTVLTIAEADAVTGAARWERQQVAAGRDVVVVRSADPLDPTTVPTENCLSLEDNPAVRSAGGIRFLGVGELRDSPGTPFRVYGGVGDIRSALSPDTSARGVSYISRVLARQIGVPDGGGALELEYLWNTGANTSAVSLSYFDPSTRNGLGNTMVLIPDDSVWIDECWAEFIPAAADVGLGIALAAFPAESTLSVSYADEQTSDGLTPLALFSRRSLFRQPIVVGMLIAVCELVVLWVGRSRLALYRSLGASRSTCVSVVGVELAFILSLGGAVAVAAAIIHQRAVAPDLLDQAVPHVVRVAFLALATGYVAGILIVALVSNGNVVSQLKDSN